MTEKRLIGVFADEDAAARAAEAAERAGGRNIVRGARVDHIDSVQNEMREQMEHTFVGPGNVGPFTKEMSKGMARWVPTATIGAMVLALPLAFVHMGRLGALTRLGIVEACAAFAGATLGFMAGMIFGPGGEGDHGIDRREEGLAAERGVVVGVTVDEAEAERMADALSAFSPVRLDKGGLDGRPLSTLETEEDRRRG
jgi:hypothetical protein